MVGLAKRLGVWCVEDAATELVVSAIEQNRAATGVLTTVSAAESAATQHVEHLVPRSKQLERKNRRLQ